MKVKRYFAQDMRTALAMVREAQGPDVVILSNRSVDGGVELITSDEPMADTDTAAAGKARGGNAAGAGNGKRFPPGGADSETLWTREPIIEQMHAELQSLRRLVETQMAGLAWGERARRDPLRADMHRRLVGIGLTPVIAEEIVAALPGQLEPRAAWRHTLALLSQAIPVAGRGIMDGGVFALVGPTGVGKSTMIAKLAARFALENGPDSLALITTDDKRLGAHEQLRSFGRILGVPVWTATGREEFERALDAGGARRLLLVDTPGGVDSEDVAALRDLLSAGVPQLRTVLVIDALAQARVVQNTVEALAVLNPSGCCISKLDEAGSLGPALSAIIGTGLPVHFLSTGQRIPEDLEPAVRHRLVARAVALHKGQVLDCDEALVRSAFEDNSHASL